VLAVSATLIWRANQDLWRTNQELRQNSYFQRIALAEREWSANDLRGMEQLLEACPADLRGWEWHYLRRRRHKSLPIMTHAQVVLSVTVSRDGGRIASCSQDGIVKIWDATTGREILSFQAHKNHARSVAFS